MKKDLRDFIIDLSKKKNEPKWMLDFRLKAYEAYLKLPEPSFGPTLDINYDEINYYKDNKTSNTDNWDNVRKDIKDTFDKLGVIDAECKYLGGVTNQYESEVVYHSTSLDNDKIIFCSTDDALKNHEELFKKYFNSLVNYNENKFTALNGAFWSGGSFIYIPPYTKLDRPLQSYFRIESESLGQFERTIIIVDEGSELEYIEGCTALSHAKASLHAGVVEIFVHPKAKCRYSTIQNWSDDVYNLVTKRAIVEEYGKMEWIDGNIGSKVTMKYPSCILKGDNSIGNSISIAYAKNNQFLDAGAKMIHLGKNTKSSIISKAFIYNSLISFAVGVLTNIEPELILKGIKEFKLTANRIDIIDTNYGVKIINGSYNASVDSMKSSLEILKNTFGKRKIAVLGDMLELDEYSKELHSEVGKYTNDLDILITVGKEAKYIADVSKAKKIISFDNNNDAINYLKENLTHGDIVLIKASNGMKFIDIVNAVK